MQPNWKNSSIDRGGYPTPHGSFSNERVAGGNVRDVMGDARIGIVGAGPAGARAAELLASRGADVLLLDPKAPWEKPCGGGLTSSIFDEFPDLTAVKAFARRVDHARVELGSEIRLHVPLGRPTWVVAREQLGRWQLARAVAAGAVHEQLRVRGVTRAAHGWLLETDRGAVGVRTLIGADGATSLVRRATGSPLRLDPILARVEYPRVETPGDDMLVLRFFPDVVGYLWDFPRPSHRSVGVEATRATGTRAVLDAALDEYAGAHAAGSRVGAVIGSSRSGWGRFAALAGEDWALLGDAAGLADPFTGEGIRNALRSASLLSEAHRSPAADWTRAYARSARWAFGAELAAAAAGKHVLSESGLGVALLRRAAASDDAYAFVAAIVDSLAEHDYALAHLFTGWLRRRRRGRTVDCELTGATTAS